MNILRFIFFLLFCCVTNQLLASDSTVVKSPDGNLSIRFFKQNEQLSFDVSLRGKPILNTSAVNFSVNGSSVTQHIRIISVHPYNINETYPVLGNHAMAVNKCQGSKITLQSGEY